MDPCTSSNICTTLWTCALATSCHQIEVFMNSQGQDSCYVKRTKKEKASEQCLPSSIVANGLYLLHRSTQLATRCLLYFLQDC